MITEIGTNKRQCKLIYPNFYAPIPDTMRNRPTWTVEHFTREGELVRCDIYHSEGLVRDEAIGIAYWVREEFAYDFPDGWQLPDEDNVRLTFVCETTARFMTISYCPF